MHSYDNQNLVPLPSLGSPKSAILRESCQSKRPDDGIHSSFNLATIAQQCRQTPYDFPDSCIQLNLPHDNQAGIGMAPRGRLGAVLAPRALLLWTSVLLGCLVHPAVSEYGPKDAVVVLTEKNFEAEVLNSPDYWLVEFYAPWYARLLSMLSLSLLDGSVMYFGGQVRPLPEAGARVQGGGEEAQEECMAE